jgi:branched-chain amino acid transport system substrate-binding protein
MILAQEEIKASHPKVHLNIHFEDSGADPKTALSALERLYRLEGCRLIVSSVSGVTLALLPLVRREGLLLFANAAHPEITTGKGNVFRYSNTVDEEARTIAAFLPTLQSPRCYCVALNDDYGKSYVAELSKLAVANEQTFTIVGTDMYDRTTNDFRTMLTKAKKANPQVFVLVGSGRTLGLLIRQLREGGFKGPFVASLGFIVTPEALESAGESMRGGYFLNYGALADPRVSLLHKNYVNRFHEEPSPTILLDYSILYVLVDAYTAVGPDPNKLGDFLRSKAHFETPIGALSSLGMSNIIAPVRVQAVPPSGIISLWDDK